MNKFLKHGSNERTVLHTLTRVYIAKPEEPWGYGVNIIKVEDGNFNEGDYRKTRKAKP